MILNAATMLGLKVWPEFVEHASSTAKEQFFFGGWRGGKSATATFIVFMMIIYELLQREGRHLVWFVGPEYRQARQEFFYLLQWCEKYRIILGEPSVPMQGPMSMLIGRAGFPGRIEIETKQAGDPTSLGSVAPVIILCCEAGQFSEESMLWLSGGRAVEKNPTILWSGTFENEDGKPQYAWFEELAAKVLANPSARQTAFTLPTWENLSIFGNCLEGENSITDDPTLIPFCPDENHGSDHHGINHPMIRKTQQDWINRPKEWRKRFGGEPVGVTNPIYEWASTNPAKYLLPMPEELKGYGPGGLRRPWLLTAGGVDFGLGGELNHPSALTIVSMTHAGDIWVRASFKDKSGSMDWLYGLKDSLDRQYQVTPGYWGGDPVATKFNPEFLDLKSVASGSYTRLGSVGVVNGYAISSRLFFDSTGPGVQELFRDLQMVHFHKVASGRVEYDRVNDDMPASFEDAVVMLHQPIARIPEHVQMRRPRPEAKKHFALQGKRRGL